MGRLSTGKFLTVVLLTASSLMLGACRESEQDRFVRYEPGVYKGKMDDQLSDAQSTAVRNRAVQQIGAGIGTGAVGMISGDVRPPE
ncbi:MAG: hypothetical protein RIC16_08955 [Rhodospirillales bacterium]